MRICEFRPLSLVVLLCSTLTACRQPSKPVATEQLLALERGALDRWNRGDPLGYLELYAPDVTYFDPFTAARVDGYQAMEQRLLPIAGKISIARYELLNPTVTRHSDLALLTYNLINYVRGPDGQERVLNRWNCTEVYRRQDGRWRIVHSHWSLTKPELRPASPAGSD